MSDFRNDSNFARQGMQDYDPKVQWAAVAVILLLVGGMIAAATFTDTEQQTAMNIPALEASGSAGSLGSAATMPAPPPQLRH
jgi:hypothetical protein